MLPLAIGAVLAVMLMTWAVVLYNGWVKGRNRAKNAWSQIDVQLKRRHDLIPNLVETVRGFAAHEQETLESVIEARARATAAPDVRSTARAESALGGALGRLMVVAEQYPALQANDNFLALQEELASTENRIGFARQHYNDSVMDYNTAIQSFPANFLSGSFGFTEETHFELTDEAARRTPAVAF